MFITHVKNVGIKKLVIRKNVNNETQMFPGWVDIMYTIEIEESILSIVVESYVI